MNVTEFGKKPQKYFRFQKAEYIYIYNQYDEHRN